MIRILVLEIKTNSFNNLLIPVLFCYAGAIILICIDKNADCTDNEGSYTCMCSTGYTGDSLSNCESESLFCIFYTKTSASCTLHACQYSQMHCGSNMDIRI